MHELVLIVAKYVVVVPVLAWVVVLVLLPKTSRVRFVLFSAACVGVTLLLVKLATTIHSDPRPFMRDGVHPYFKSSTDNGFPSDHTVFSALLAFVIMHYRRNVGLGLLAVAVAIGGARVISGVHHGQDIVAGVVIAGLATYSVVGAHYLYCRIVKRAASQQ